MTGDEGLKKAIAFLKGLVISAPAGAGAAAAFPPAAVTAEADRVAADEAAYWAAVC